MIIMATMRMIKVLDKNRTLVVKNRIVIPRNGSIEFVDWRGFIKAEINDKGDLIHKGKVIKR